MTDTKSQWERSRNMAAIKGKNTKPEMTVRKFLFSKGLRYRIHGKNLPGKPDIVLKKYKTVIFINGCFWHGHENCRYSHLPKSNVEYWTNKISNNKKRDSSIENLLQSQGWKVLRVWECQLKRVNEREKTLELLFKNIINQTESYSIENSEIKTAAEPEGIYSNFSRT